MYLYLFLAAIFPEPEHMMLTRDARRIGNGAIDHIQLVIFSFLRSPRAPPDAPPFPLRVTKRQDMYLTHYFIDHLRTSMANCKCHLWALLQVRGSGGLLGAHLSTLISFSLTDVPSALSMDCIYLSQKFGRPLVRRLRAVVSFRSTPLTAPLSSPMIHGKTAQPSHSRVFLI